MPEPEFVYIFTDADRISISCAEQMTGDYFSDNVYTTNVKEKKLVNPRFIESRLRSRWTEKNVENGLRSNKEK